MVRKDLARFVQENPNDQRIRIATLKTKELYARQNSQKSSQSNDSPSQIASLPTTYRTALPIYENWELGTDTTVIKSSPIQLKEKIQNDRRHVERIQETHMANVSFTSEHYNWILSGGKSMINKGKHVLLEQVIFAALDCHRYEVADACISILATEFPGSMRVLRYRACRLEAAERYEEALEVLDNLIKNDETNAAARKRRVAILKAQRLTSEAIKELVEYLKKFMSDVEGWQELCELYLTVQEYSKAVFCAEELLLHQPHSHLFHQQVADIRYTMGGVDNMELAKYYYCQALILNPDNNRALLGLFLVTNNLLSHYKSGSSSRRKEVWRLSQWAQQRVARAYHHAARAPTSGATFVALDALLADLAVTD
ncbi:ER membrane protein complex subunit 2-A [Eumeta japonica]|uniref:ER membrane protein complex subunit 2 n=1 Tax=Eumeta variegata TaxID=151549 RepID=A0A4C1ZQG6_EUMVA|nr:ER membrane protein complex subunit 2-A [Eumeta japonica]